MIIRICSLIQFCFPLLLTLLDLVIMICNVEQWQSSLFCGLLFMFQAYLYVLQIKSSRKIQLVESEQYVCMMVQIVWTVYFLQNYLTKEQIIVLITSFSEEVDNQPKGEYTAIIELIFTIVMMIFMIFSEIKRPTITVFIFTIILYSILNQAIKLQRKFKKQQSIELPITSVTEREKSQIQFDIMKQVFSTVKIQFTTFRSVIKFNIIQDNYKYDLIKIFPTIDQFLANLKISWNDSLHENVNIVTLSQYLLNKKFRPSISILTNVVQHELVELKQDNTVIQTRRINNPTGIKTLESIPLVFSNFSKQQPHSRILSQQNQIKQDSKKELFEKISEYQSVYNYGKSDCDKLLGHVKTENGQTVYYLIYIHSECKYEDGNIDITLQFSNSFTIPFFDDPKYTILEHFFLVQSKQCQISYKSMYKRFQKNQKNTQVKQRHQMFSFNKSLEQKESPLYNQSLEIIEMRQSASSEEVQILQDIQLCSLLMLMVNQNFNVYDLLKPAQPLTMKKFNFSHTLENITLLLQFHPDYIKNNIHFQIKDSCLDKIFIVNDERKVKQFFINLLHFIMLLKNQKEKSEKKATENKIYIYIKENKEFTAVEVIVPEITYPQEFRKFNFTFNPETFLNTIKFHFYATLTFSNQIGSSVRIKFPNKENGVLKIIVKLYSKEQPDEIMEVYFESQEDIIDEEEKQWSEILNDNEQNN